MRNNRGDKLEYTNREHISRTKRIKYQKLIENYKLKNGISEIENELTSFNSKSCLYNTFKSYIRKKNNVNDVLLDKYVNEVFRKYKWYDYINRKKVETKIVNEIKEKFGKDVTLIYGDWSQGYQMKHQISTPNLGLKRKLGEYFKIYNIDEYRTSCLNHKTLQRNENMYLPDKKGIVRKIHSILTYDHMESNRKGCINRDSNAVKNMLTITNQYIKDKTRPLHFKRGVKLEDILNVNITPIRGFNQDLKIGVKCKPSFKDKDPVKSAITGKSPD